MINIADLVDLVAHPPGALGGLTLREVAHDGQVMADDIQGTTGVSEVQAAEMLRLQSELLVRVDEIVRGDS